MDRMIKATVAFMVVLMTAGCTRSYDPEPPALRMPPAPTLTLATLHALYGSGSGTLEQELVVAGTVTSSDRAGNFYRTLCIEQGGYGLEILVGGESLHSRYPMGARLHLRLRGLALARSRGVLQAGVASAAYNYQELEYLTAQPLVDEHLFRGEVSELPTGMSCSIAELTPERCGTLVEVEGLKHEPLTEESTTLEGYHRFVNSSGEALHLYISPYARFASEPLPTGEVTLRGILQYLSTGDQAGPVIKPNDESDIII